MILVVYASRNTNIDTKFLHVTRIIFSITLTYQHKNSLETLCIKHYKYKNQNIVFVVTL